MPAQDLWAEEHQAIARHRAATALAALPMIPIQSLKDFAEWADLMRDAFRRGGNADLETLIMTATLLVSSAHAGALAVK